MRDRGRPVDSEDVKEAIAEALQSVARLLREKAAHYADVSMVPSAAVVFHNFTEKALLEVADALDGE